MVLMFPSRWIASTVNRFEFSFFCVALRRSTRSMRAAVFFVPVPQISKTEHKTGNMYNAVVVVGGGGGGDGLTDR